jgi:hypothetical protein
MSVTWDIKRFLVWINLVTAREVLSAAGIIVECEGNIA